MKIFICGSISIKKLSDSSIKNLKNIMQKNYTVLVGDALGVDLNIQKFYNDNEYNNVVVYHINDFPRNKICDKFQSKKCNFDEKLEDKNNKEREKQTFKDEKMVQDCDFFYCIWDGKSKGSYTNIKKAIDSKKTFIKIECDEKEYVYYNNGAINNNSYTLTMLKNKIDEIFEKNNGYSLKEVFDILKEENAQHKIKFDDFKKNLVKAKLLEVLEKDKKVVYCPVEKRYGIENLYKGKPSSYRYTGEFIDLARKVFDVNYKEPSLFSC
ncbi:hypothetical protein [Campylobacter armoricus]|uniref:Uncharacterized protein n=1 Tax=Campylobacter armoricus TaxID=2505970 RepID=A0A7L5ID37_9BACT|nr:hypothetical protein [Campylobacter armoricus]QKF80433.1 hypothetical protein CARM_1554 [Campylobacter armoricus]